MSNSIVTLKKGPQHYEFHAKASLAPAVSVHLLSLEYEMEHQAYILTMVDKDHRLNPSFTLCMHKALDVVEETATTTTTISSLDVSALITIGLGRIYSNGLDLAFFLAPRDGETAPKEAGMDRIYHFIHTDLVTLFTRLLVFPIPTVAAINGHAYAGGFLLALAHDFRIMAATVPTRESSSPSYLCLNEIEIGVTLPQVFMCVVASKIHDANAVAASLLEAKKWSAEEALSHGLIHGICQEGTRPALLAACSAFLQTRKLFPGPVSAALKRVIYRPQLDLMQREMTQWNKGRGMSTKSYL